MQTIDDRALLREYAETGSEAAFAELLRRHADLVYSSALRRVGNPEQAEEITQAVFIILARKARSLNEKVVLSGWLYRAASLAAANFIRTETRRKRREMETLMQPPSNEIEADNWTQIGPLLDKAMDGLNRGDREAIVLRFFEGKSMQEVGNVCGISENAAKKRVYHGLERLRKFFCKRGLVLTSAIISGAIASNSVRAAPPGLLAKTAVAATAGGKVSALVAGTLKLMLWQKLKLFFAYSASAVVLVGAVPIASSMLARKTATVYLEGTVTRYSVDENGSTNFGTITNFGLTHFSLSRKGDKWAIRMEINTNLTGGATVITCDGTDIYGLVPGAGGTQGWGQNLVPFLNVGTIQAGTIRCTFQSALDPIWWGYCNSFAEKGSGLVPDFTSDGSQEKPMIPNRMAYEQISETNADCLGPSEMNLYRSLDSGGFSTNAYCDIRPLEATNIDGMNVVTECDMRIFRWRPEHSGAEPKILFGYILKVDAVNLHAPTPTFVPQFQGLTMFNDYRTTHYWEDYVSDHWIDPGETSRHSPLPVVLGPMGKDVNDKKLYVAAARSPKLVGKFAPPFHDRTTTGQLVQLPEDYRGKLIFLDFWATWCSPCLAELPNVSAAYQKFGSRGIEFLGVSLDKKETVNKLGAFCQTHNMPWAEICDGKEWNAAIAKLYSVEEIPESFLIDGDTGKVLLQGDSLRGDKIIPALEDALKNKHP